MTLRSSIDAQPCRTIARPTKTSSPSLGWNRETVARDDRPLARCRILVTGGSGFIGSQLAGRAVQAGAQVLAVDRRRSGPPRRSPGGLVLCDIRSPQLVEVAAGFRPDVVIHLAAQVGVPASVDCPVWDAEVNVLGTIAVAQTAVAAGARLLVFAGSCAVYGSPEVLPVSERHPLAQTTPYGLSKAAALTYLEWFARNRGLPVTSLILGNVYGRRLRGEQGGVISRFMSDAAVGRPSLLHGGGERTRDFVHVNDVADAMLRACVMPAAGRVNIGSGVETSISAVQALVGDATRTTIVARRTESRTGEVERMCLRIDRAATVLGWTPKIALAQGIASLAGGPTGVRA